MIFSRLAKDSSLFLAWRSSVKIWLEDDPCERAKTLYNQLREFKPPRWLNDIDVSLEKAFAGQGELFQQLKEWGGQQLDSSADDADTYNLRILLPALCFSFLKIKNSILQNKKSQRRGLEDIIEFAFGVGKGNFNILYESSIRLRESPEVAVCPNAIVDTLVTFPVTNLKGKPVKPDDLLKTAEFTVVRNAWWSPDPRADISVIVFPSEYKRPDLDTNCNQVIIDFCTTQSQRRTLGAEDDIIFGMAAARGEAVIYSCWWEGDEMFYAKHEAWMLTDPRQFIGFYVFLCNLANHARKSLQTMFTSYQANDRVTALTTHLWRAPDHPPKQTYERSRLSSDGSGDDRQAGGSGD
ncbi:hypothetical protein A0H81_10856 [Grifola frondosa]|uniref:Uncharacterized protein n=1 Tax=Grifola frondosa TaxID=5627 RepID=A0A1C7LYJ5_GRIFR|nr:hypothetical protein A0H81_10856 [Grifola frondosa]